MSNYVIIKVNSNILNITFKDRDCENEYKNANCMILTRDKFNFKGTEKLKLKELEMICKK